MKGPPFGVPFSNWAHPWSSKCGSRRTNKELKYPLFKLDYKKIALKDQVLLQEGFNSRIFRMEEEDVEDEIPGEIVSLRVQDDESEVRF